ELPKLMSEKLSLESKLKLVESNNLLNIIEEKNILKSAEAKMMEYKNIYFKPLDEVCKSLEELTEKNNADINKLEKELLAYDQQLDVSKYLKDYLKVVDNIRMEITSGLSEMLEIESKYK